MAEESRCEVSFYHPTAFRSQILQRMDEYYEEEAFRDRFKMEYNKEIRHLTSCDIASQPPTDVLSFQRFSPNSLREKSHQNVKTFGRITFWQIIMVWFNCGELLLLDDEAEMALVPQKATKPLIFPKDLSGEMYLEGALHIPRFAF